jgi:acyl transferase domain-containing protein
VRGADAIAVVGISCRFPGAPDVESYWQSLRGGVESIRELRDDELRAAGVSADEIEDPRYVRRVGVLEGIDLFDAGFFGYSPREATLIDPQQRLFLECAASGLQSAGYDARATDALIGVFAGGGLSSYFLNNVIPNPGFADVGDLEILVSVDKDYLASRVAYKLDLRGPVVTVQTACSSSLVATHLACQALLAGECDVAIAGGVSLYTPGRGYLAEEGGVMSPDGRCRTFDADARGAVPGSGVGVVVLRRLEDALADEDTVRAVIRGSAVANDGADRVGFTAPGVHGQAFVIAEALAAGAVDPSSIGYVEAHGAATPLGDPVEVAALTQAFGGASQPGHRCALGSVKTNIGHLDAAAGVAGLIKAVLAVERGEIPPTLNFRSPNPNIDFDSSPFFVNTELIAWPVADRPRRAGVSSFGLGGTNAHVVVEEPPVLKQPVASDRPHVVVLSGLSQQAIERSSAELADALERDGTALADAAWTLQVGRPQLPHRRVVVGADWAEAARALRGGDATRTFSAFVPSRPRSLAFLFPGVGDHYLGMGAGLYETEPVYRRAVDRCVQILRDRLDLDLEAFARDSSARARARDDGKIDFNRLVKGEPASASELDATRLVQPLSFAVDYALAQLWLEHGASPAALAGYSIGEYVAACVGGVLDLPSALELVGRRALAIDALPGGAMLAVLQDADPLAAFLPPEVSVAAVDGPSLTVVAGPGEAIDEVESELTKIGIASRRLRARHAFHSSMMEPLAKELEALLEGYELRPPTIPILSNVTGSWLTDEQATDPRYWAEHLHRPIRFAENLAELWQLPEPVLLEVGPGRALGSLAMQHPARSSVVDPVVLRSLPSAHDGESEPAVLATTLGRLWAAGVPIDWRARGRRGRRRIPLPVYPFERERFWIDPPTVESSSQRISVGATRRKDDPADWFYLPSWRRSLVPVARVEPAAWLVLGGDPFGERLADALASIGDRVTLAAGGDGFAADGEGRFLVDLLDEQRISELLSVLDAGNSLPDRIVHCVGVADDPCDETLPAFRSLLALAQALARRRASSPVEISVVTACAQAVAGEPFLAPPRAAALGLARVIPQELASVVVRTIDVLPDELAHDLDELVRELASAPADLAIAWRGHERLVQTFEPVRVERSDRAAIRARGAYALVGGLGLVGSAVARYLAEHANARLAIIQRTQLESPGDGADERAELARRTIRELEELGAEVATFSVDAADTDALARAFAAVEERFGSLDGVVHVAGVVGDGATEPLETIADASIERHFRPKADIANALLATLGGRTVDFCIVASSLASVLGGIGHGVYAAANAYVDLFAVVATRSGRTRWTAVDWEAWDSGEWRHGLAPGETLTGYLITSEEGEDVFGRILASGLPPRIVNSSGSLELRLRQWVGGPPLASEPESVVTTPHPRPNLQSAYVAPADTVESELAAIWGELLGIDAVGAADNFFELGGHSLVATRVVARIVERLSVRVPLGTFLTHPTIGQLAETIREGAVSVAEPHGPAIRQVDRERFRLDDPGSPPVPG